MKVKTDLFAHVKVVKAQKIDGNVSMKCSMTFKFSIFLKRLGLVLFIFAFAKSEADTFDKLIFLKSTDELMDPVDLEYYKSNPDEFDPWMYFQNLIKMFYDPKANLKIKSPSCGSIYRIFL